MKNRIKKVKHKYLSKLLCLITLFSLLIPGAMAQENKNQSTARNNMTMGFQYTLNGQQVEMGVQATSHYYKERIALRAVISSSAPNRLQIFPQSTNNVSVRLGLVIRQTIVAGKINIYQEGGLMPFSTRADLKHVNWRPGAYGLLGLEIHANDLFTQFFELGAAGYRNFNSTKHGHEPYSTNLLAAAGIRYSF